MIHAAHLLQLHHQKFYERFYTTSDTLKATTESVDNMLFGRDWKLSSLQPATLAQAEKDDAEDTDKGLFSQAVDFIGLGRLEEVCADPNTIKSGYLFLRSPSSFLGVQWVRRYFKLTYDGYFVG